MKTSATFSAVFILVSSLLGGSAMAGDMKKYECTLDQTRHGVSNSTRFRVVHEGRLEGSESFDALATVRTDEEGGRVELRLKMAPGQDRCRSEARSLNYSFPKQSEVQIIAPECDFEARLSCVALSDAACDAYEFEDENGRCCGPKNTFCGQW